MITPMPMPMPMFITHGGGDMSMPMWVATVFILGCVISVAGMLSVAIDLTTGRDTIFGEIGTKACVIGVCLLAASMVLMLLTGMTTE